MTDIILALILLMLIVIALGVHRVSNILLSFWCSYTEGNREISEVLWAKMGCSREEWHKVNNEARIAELSDRHRRGEN
jgi:hypothetical protein